jgi:Methyltransferase FkbM domain
MNRLYEDLNEDQWLLRHARVVTSEFGEDGVLEKVLEVIGPANRWCVEFGAWDGKVTSNTYTLMKQRQWSGLFLEPHPKRFQDLLATYSGQSRARCLNRFVDFAGSNSLDSILNENGVPADFDLLSIDVDGNDYHVWDSLRNYRPRIVVIEFNLSIPSHVEFVQPRNWRVGQGSSPLSLAILGRSKGYELVCLTKCNAIFVQKPLFPAFGIKDNSPLRLRPKTDFEYHIFQLYDGTFVVGGPKLMHWQALPLRQEKFQVLPKILRRPEPPAQPLFIKLLRRIWRFLYLRGLA